MTTSPAAALAALRWAKTTPDQRTEHARMMALSTAKSRAKQAKVRKSLRKRHGEA